MANVKSILHLIASFTFITSAATTACFFQGLSYILVRPFSSTQHRRICVRFTYAFFLMSTFLLERWSSVMFKGYGDPIPPKKSTFIILNHSSSVDFLIGLAYLAKLGYPHPGNAKSAVKAALGTVPLFGTTLFFAEFLFLSRSWAADRETFVKKLLSLRDFEKTIGPFSFVLFPEGTRLTPERQKRCNAYTESIGEPPLNHLLYPRFKGFTTTLEALGDRLDGIVDATLIFDNDHPSLKRTISGNSNTLIHAHTKYYPIDTLPKGEEELQKWLKDRWYEKEERIVNFRRDPKTLGDSCNDTLFPVEHPSLLPLIALVVFFFVLAVVSLYVASKFPRGIFTLTFCSLWVAVLVGMLTMINNRPSKEGPSKSR